MKIEGLQGFIIEKKKRKIREKFFGIKRGFGREFDSVKYAMKKGVEI